MSGQPYIPEDPALPALWRFDISKVNVFEAGGITPSLVVNQPNTFRLEVVISNDGPLAGTLAGHTPTIELHAERIEDGLRVALPFHLPPGFEIPPGLTPVMSDLPPYTTGPLGSGADLEVGSWQVMAHIHYTPPDAMATIAAAFYEFWIMVI